MKITREEARELLEVEEDASHATLKKAYYAKALEWHPDKVEEARKEEATVVFQKVSAAYQRLLKDESSDEEEWSDEEGCWCDDPMERFFQFFAYMEAKMQAEAARRRGYGGRPGGGPFMGMGGGFGSPMMRMRMPDGTFVAVHAAPGFGPFMGPDDDDEDDAYYRRSRPSKPHQARGGNQRYGRRYVEESESESSSYVSSVDSDDSEYERMQERLFMRMKAEERAAEQNRVKEQYDNANRRRREAAERDARWLQRLSRPTRTAHSDASITLDVDRGKQSRLSDFEQGQLPPDYFWQLQYRPLVPNQPPGDWQQLEVRSGGLTVEVTGLQPGTKYAFRARPCKAERASSGREEGAAEETATQAGEWSTEAQYATSGTAAQRSSAATPAAPAASRAAAAKPAGQGKKSQRKAKAAERQEAERSAAQKRAEQAAAEAERRQQEEAAKERARQAVIARAQAEYEQEAEKVRRHAEKQAAAAAPAPAVPPAQKAAQRQAPQQAKRQPGAGKGGKGSGNTPAAAAGGSMPRTDSGSTAKGSRAGAPAPAPAPATRQPEPEAEADNYSSSIPEEFRLPAGYRPQAPLGAPAPKPRDAFASQPAMCAPTTKQEVLRSKGAPLGARRPSAAGRAAVSGADGAEPALALEAAAHGMSVLQYRAYQEDLALQEAIQMSLALEESRRMAEEAQAAPQVEDAAQFPSLVQPAAGPSPSSQQQQQDAAVGSTTAAVPPPPGPRPSSQSGSRSSSQQAQQQAGPALAPAAAVPPPPGPRPGSGGRQAVAPPPPGPRPGSRGSEASAEALVPAAAVPVREAAGGRGGGRGRGKARGGRGQPGAAGAAAPPEAQTQVPALQGPPPPLPAVPPVPPALLPSHHPQQASALAAADRPGSRVKAGYQAYAPPPSRGAQPQQQQGQEPTWDAPAPAGNGPPSSASAGGQPRVVLVPRKGRGGRGGRGRKGARQEFGAAAAAEPAGAAVSQQQGLSEQQREQSYPGYGWGDYGQVRGSQPHGRPAGIAAPASSAGASDGINGSSLAAAAPQGPPQQAPSAPFPDPQQQQQQQQDYYGRTASHYYQRQQPLYYTSPSGQQYKAVPAAPSYVFEYQGRSEAPSTSSVHYSQQQQHPQYQTQALQYGTQPQQYSASYQPQPHQAQQAPYYQQYTSQQYSYSQPQPQHAPAAYPLAPQQAQHAPAEPQYTYSSHQQYEQYHAEAAVASHNVSPEAARGVPSAPETSSSGGSAVAYANSNGSLVAPVATQRPRSVGSYRPLQYARNGATQADAVPQVEHQGGARASAAGSSSGLVGGVPAYLFPS